MSSKRVLVTGCRGQLGSDLMSMLADAYEISGCDIGDFDITDRDKVLGRIAAINPDVVLHAAAWTDVDACETDEAAAMAVNAEAAGHVAEACRENGARMIFYSTDYVFDGTATSPYTETAAPNPQSVYGRSKLEGEQRVADMLDPVAILRLAWVYGFHGRNFVRTMIKLGWEQTRAGHRGEIITPIKVVDDQTGNPTWTAEIVRQTAVVLEKDLAGLFHCTAEGETSWYGLAKQVFETLGLTVYVRPCTTKEFPRPAPRPAYSSLENERFKQLGLNVMRDYTEALHEFLSGRKEALLACHATSKES